MTKRATHLIRADVVWNNYDPPRAEPEQIKSSAPRLGILMVPDDIGLRRVKMVLPTGHAIVATRPHPLLAYTEAMIEGPMMPNAPPGQAPRTVRLICQQDGTPSLSCHWEHMPGQTWTSVVG